MSAARLEDAIAILTGASAGIGAATARAFVREGARVVMVARRRETLLELQQELGSDVARVVVGDVASGKTPARVVAEAVAWGGRVDVLVNNAGIDLSSAPLLDTGEEAARRVFDVNFFGAARMLQEVARAMLGGGGSIVNVTSRTALVGVPGMAMYGASKGALQSLTRTAAVELACEGIRVNAVAPGLTETPLVRAWIDRQQDPAAFRQDLIEGVPLGTLASPEQVAAAIVYLASPDAASVTGASLSVDGGYTAA